MATAALHNHSCNSRLGFTPPLTFGPVGTEHLGERLDVVPRLLFRFAHKYSRSSTDGNSIKPPAVIRGTDAATKIDIFRRSDKRNVAEMLMTHFTGYKSHDSDNLITWNASLPYMLSIIIMHQAIAPENLDELQLFIVDSQRLPARTFIRSVALVRAFCQYDKRLKRIHDLKGDLWVGDDMFTSQGEFAIGQCCETITATQLIQAGLFTACPALYLAFAKEGRMGGKDRSKIVERCYDTSIEARVPATREEISTVNELACLFNGKYRAMLGLWLFACTPRRLDDAGILEWAREQDLGECLTMNLAKLEYSSNLLNLADLKHFTAIVQAVRTDVERRSVTPSRLLAQAVNDLDNATAQLRQLQLAEVSSSDVFIERLEHVANKIDSLSAIVRSMMPETSRRSVTSSKSITTTNKIRRHVSPSNSIRDPAEATRASMLREAATMSERTEVRQQAESAR